MRVDELALRCHPTVEDAARLEGRLDAGPLAGIGPSAEGDEAEGLSDAASAEDLLARAETVAAVRAAMADLPDQERHLVQRHYFDDVRFDLAAQEIGLSKSWASRLHGRAIESMTRHLKRAKVTR